MAMVERLGCWWTTSNFAITFFLLRYLRKIGKNMSFLCANVKTRKPTSLSWNLWPDSLRNHFLWRLKGLKLRRREGSILCFRDIRLAHYNRLHNIEWIFVIPTSILCQWLNLLIPHSWSVNFLNFFMFIISEFENYREISCQLQKVVEMLKNYPNEKLFLGA